MAGDKVDHASGAIYQSTIKKRIETMINELNEAEKRLNQYEHLFSTTKKEIIFLRGGIEELKKLQDGNDK